MLISKMITKLQAILKDHGDLPVCHVNGSYIEDVKSVRGINEAKHLKESLKKPIEMVLIE